MRFYFRSKNARLAAMLRNPNQNTRPRIAPVTPPYDADTTAALEALGPPIGIFRVFARRPDRAHGLAGIPPVPRGTVGPVRLRAAGFPQSRPEEEGN